MRRSFVDPEQGRLSIRRQCELLGIHRSGVYYQPQGESDFNLSLMRKIDGWMLEEPTSGVITMIDFLKDEGIIVNHKRIRRLMRLMGLILMVIAVEFFLSGAKPILADIFPALTIRA